MKSSIASLLGRTSLVLLTLVGGLPSETLFAKDTLTEGAGRPNHLGSDGVGGIEKNGPPMGGPSSKNNPGHGSGGPLGGATATALPDPWIDLGATFGSVDASPILSGSGTGEPGSLATLTLSGAKPGSVAALVVGISLANVPFKGGTMVPAPMLIVPGLPVNADGKLALPAMLPASLPSGFALYMQMWMPDGDAMHGFASSNGLELLVP
jgi:hypothetical protein